MHYNKTKENTNLRRAQEILDKSHYGMNKVKDRIIEYLAILKNTKKTNFTKKKKFLSFFVCFYW